MMFVLTLLCLSAGAGEVVQLDSTLRVDQIDTRYTRLGAYQDGGEVTLECRVRERRLGCQTLKAGEKATVRITRIDAARGFVHFTSRGATVKLSLPGDLHGLQVEDGD